MAEGKVEVQSITIASWNIMGKGSKGSSERRQKVLSSYLDQIKKGQCTFSIPDLVFLQEVPWVAKGDIAEGMLKGTSYDYTADSWVKEKGGPCNVVLHNEARLTAYRDRRIPVKLYRKLDEKRENAMKIHCKYSTEEELQEAKSDPDVKYVLEEFQDRDSIAYFNKCFKRPKDQNVQRAETLLEGRIGVGIFELRYGEVKPKLISVSFHNRRPKEEPDKLLCLLLHFLKELTNIHNLLGYAVVLAGDFNMDVNKKKMPHDHVKRLLKDYKPQEYPPTSHRGFLLPCIDNILLWDKRGVFALGPIQAHMIEVGAAGIPKDERKEMKLRYLISNHDPLTAVLTIRSKPMVEGDRQPQDLEKVTDLFRKLAISPPPLDNPPSTPHEAVTDCDDNLDDSTNFLDDSTFAATIDEYVLTDDSTSADKSSDRSALFDSLHSDK